MLSLPATAHAQIALLARTVTEHVYHCPHCLSSPCRKPSDIYSRRLSLFAVKEKPTKSWRRRYRGLLRSKKVPGHPKQIFDLHNGWGSYALPQQQQECT